MHFLGAELRSGFELVAGALDLERRIREADFVLTGEGSMDASSLDGKGPVGVARIAATLGRPVYAIAGQITDEVRAAGLFRAVTALSDTGRPLTELMGEASALVAAGTARMLSATPPECP